MTRVEQCAGFDALRIRHANRWAVYEDARSMGVCEECGKRLVGRYRIEHRYGLSRFVCSTHPIAFVIPDVSTLTPPRPGSHGAMRLEATP